MEHRLEEMIAEAARQRDEVSDWLGRLDQEAFSRRPRPDRWSIGEHIAHLPLTDRPYFPGIEAALARARAKGRLADGPFEGGKVGNWFAGWLEPPPRRRMRTSRKLDPPSKLDRLEVSADFAACRDELVQLMRMSEGVDLDRARLSSPFLALLRMPVSSAYAVLLAHGRRHVWLAREGSTA